MAKSGIKLKFTGFDELIDNIKKADGNIEKSVNSAMNASAQIVYDEMKKQMSSAKPKPVDSKLINRMPPPTVEWEQNRCTASVGYEKGKYNPKNLTDGYKAIFINYGTPRIKPRKFIEATKKKSAAQVKKKQEEVFKKILERLKK